MNRSMAEIFVGMVPPHTDKENDQSVFATLVADVAADEIVGPEIDRQREWIYANLEPKHFYCEPDLGRLYGFCRDLYREGLPVTFVTLAQRMNEEGVSDADRDKFANFLEAASEQLSSGMNGEHYAREMVKAACMRDACMIMQSGLSSGMTSPSNGRLLETTAEKLLEVRAKMPDKGVKLGAVSAESIYAALEAEAANPGRGIVPTGYASFDRLLGGGLRGGDMAAIGGRPGTGKSSFALGAAWQMALSGKRVLYCSLEMSKEQLGQRLLAMASGVPLSRIRRPQDMSEDDWEAVYAAQEWIADLPLVLEDAPTLTPSKLAAIAGRMKGAEGLDCIVVDYLQLMHGDGRFGSREQELSEISHSIKALAMRHSIPVIALVQLNRKLEERDDKRPMLADIRESGAIEQDADLIAFLSKDMSGRVSVSPDVPVDLVVAKQRSGPQGTLRMLFRGACTAYMDADVNLDALTGFSAGTPYAV